MEIGLEGITGTEVAFQRGKGKSERVEGSGKGTLRAPPLYIEVWMAGEVGLENTGLAHSAWCVRLKMSWRSKLGRLDQLGKPNGDREVREDRQLREGGKNRITTIRY